MNSTVNIEDGQILIAKKVFGWEYKEDELIREDSEGIKRVNHVKYFMLESVVADDDTSYRTVLELQDFDIHNRREWWNMSLYNQDPIFDRLYNIGMMEKFEDKLMKDYEIFNHISITQFLLSITTIDLFTYLVDFLQEI